MSITSWPNPSSSAATDRPTAPAPAMATRMAGLRSLVRQLAAPDRKHQRLVRGRRAGSRGADIGHGAGHGGGIHLILSLQYRLGVRQHTGAKPHDERDPGAD